MTHDPLCPNAKGCSHDCGGCLCMADAFCQCDLIAKVRADTLDMAEQSIQSLTRHEMLSMDATAWIMKSSAIKSINNLRGGYGKDPSSS